MSACPRTGACLPSEPPWCTARSATRPAALVDVTARRIEDIDLGFLRELYASTRAEEMAATHWPDDAQRLFLAQQFELQHRHYQAHFASAEFLLLLWQGQPMGRLYWHSELVKYSGAPERVSERVSIKAQSAAVARATASICNAEQRRFGRQSGCGGMLHKLSASQGAQATLVEISLLPAYRGRGLGSALLAVITAQADLHSQPISLHVHPTNPARRLYERFGFAVIAATGGHLRMMRRPLAHAHAHAQAHGPTAETPWLLADLLQPACDSARPALLQ